MTADAFTYLFSLEHFGIKFGLDNMHAVVAAMGHPERAFRSVHIGGTNGKGSVTAFVDAALRAAGHSSGRYTSPHLVSLTERFVVNGEAVDEPLLASAVEDVRRTVDRLRASGALAVQPTFFEVTTATAFELFRNAGVDVAVCEVGLGGRLDATNVLHPMVTAITSIGLDHEQYLGTTLDAIAAEKAGIAKPGVPLVVGPVDPESARAIARVASERGAPILRALADVRVSAASVHADGTQTFTLRTPARDYGRLVLGALGRHQIDNAIVAVRVLEQVDAHGLAVPHQAIAEGLRTAAWRGRLEQIDRGDGRDALLDAAHNPAGARALADFLSDQPSPRPLVFAAMRDKNARGMLEALLPHVSALILTRASHPRSADPSSLADTAQEVARGIAPTVSIRVAESPAAALKVAWGISPRIVVAGSIFLLADVLKELNRP